jgi:glycosyltransferase involved in cell wall biosynthesis
LTQYFPPEIGSTQNRLSYLAKSLVQRGHEVTVLTALPNYPDGKIFEGYRRRVVMEERTDGMRMVRVWCYATRRKAVLPRMLNYSSFVCASLLLGTLRIGRPDVMLADSPPLFLGLSALPMKWIFGAKLVFNVADLWPESAVAMGVVQNRSMIKAATAIEEMIYRHSDLITGETRGIVENVQRRMPKKSVVLLTNGADLTAVNGKQRDRAVVRRGWAGEGNKFVVGYAGLHGLAQRLETVLEAAARLASNPDIVFLFFGDGPEKAALVEKAGRMGLQNVRFYPPQPKGQIAEVISAFDVALVPLRDLPLFRGALPSKIFEAMSLGTPVICSVPGEAQAIIEESRGGICTPPEDAQEMSNAILRLYRQPELRETMGNAAKEYVSRFYNRATIAANFESLLTRLVDSGNGVASLSAVSEGKAQRGGANRPSEPCLPGKA